MNHRSVAIVFAALGLSFGAGCAESRDSMDSPAAASSPNWAGLWVAERSFGPQFQGPVTLQRSGAEWIARLQGETAIADRSVLEDGSVDWSFAFHDQGRFAGWQQRAGAPVDGHWLQPPGMVQNYPFATPVRLVPAGDDAYRGDIVPFPQEVSLNIPLIPDGTAVTYGTTEYRTFLRNPQRNLGVFFRIETATAEGDEIRFANRDGEVLAVGRSVEPGERFTLLFPRFGETMDFTRRSRANAPGFYPRRSPRQLSSLPQPVKGKDGWQTAAPRETGLDAEPLLSLVNSIAAFEPTGLREPYIHGLLLAHRGKLVVEEYFHGYHKDMTHDSRSAGKTLTSALLGIALRKGAVASLDQPVYPLFGSVEDFAKPDPRKERMTVRHLLTMSSGFDCDDGDFDSPGNEDNMQSQYEQPDWYRFTLDLGMIREPGEAGVYCTAGLNLIGGVLREATGISLPRFFQEEFAAPLGISYYQMNLSPTYEAYMGGGIRFRPRDFLKLGQLYLDDGVWNGQRIVSKEYVQASAAPHASLNGPDDYGYAWWRQSYEVNGRNVETYYASGNGGQLLFVVPELELVAFIQAGNYSDGRTRNEFRDRFMRDAILPAALAAE
ncbi:MAG: serine hydrolase [Pseudomonadota bacterium]